ncbi:cytochrome c oxidase assembly protein [Kribbella capetownensis]|uniref:Cytochrome c oxidase assembly protein n=1 Tax=Kribbella capetownensis TaxID=1572659 RepID=A0A4R0JFM1_9ACTN|nr:cytochrome c oxidase assembly protein [Kribbella capetownensis]TCC45763.1 cytochrome c oxidase assembly protein [Kribbella capetownensis]
MHTLVSPDHVGRESGSPGLGVFPLVLVGLLAVAYLVAAVHDKRRWSHRRTAAWLVGCCSLAVAVSLMFGDGTSGVRLHMTQHLLFGMVAPLGLVLGAPVTLLLRISPPRVRRTMSRLLRSRPLHVLSHPAVAGLLSTGTLYLILLTPLYSAAENHQLLHHSLHLHYLAAGYLFTWSICGPDPAPRRPSVRVRTTALILAGAAHAVLAKLMYAQADGRGAELTGDDAAAVRTAAKLMYYGGDVVELLLALALFVTWYHHRSRLAVPAVGKARPRAGSRSKDREQRRPGRTSPAPYHPRRPLGDDH